MILSAKKEYIFKENTVTPSCHASTVLPLKDGSVLVAWFGGKKEGDTTVAIYLSKRNTDGQWSTPHCVSENDGIPHWNPVLYQRPDGQIILFYKYGVKIADWITKFVLLDTDGNIISDPRELVPGDTSGGRGPVKNKCLLLPSGRLLAPASTEQNDRWIAFTDISDDNGKTWYNNGKFERPKYRGAYVGLIQPTLWTDDKGEVHCFMRSDKGAVYRSDSSDGGLHGKSPTVHASRTITAALTAAPIITGVSGLYITPLMSIGACGIRSLLQYRPTTESILPRFSAPNPATVNFRIPQLCVKIIHFTLHILTNANR